MDGEKLILNLIGKEGYFINYEALTRHFKDIVKGALLCKFIHKYEYHRSKGELVEDKWFYYTREQIEKEMFLSEFVQRSIIKTFEEDGLVESIIFKNSIPQKKYYTINFERLVEILSK